MTAVVRRRAGAKGKYDPTSLEYKPGNGIKW
jgi:hypothetical protein